MHSNSPSTGKILATIFDLDGVITRTRNTHKKAWKEMFELFFEKHHPSQSAMTEVDYLEFIDGKPRYQGVESFLESRQIYLPMGQPDDPPGFDTVCALGNIKNRVFHEILERDGVDIYKDAVDKLKEWYARGLKTAIVSSSKNCRKILQVAGLEKMFQVRVDGLTAEQQGLNGKPDPDIFIEAARLLDVSPADAVVFEDAISGVQAGQRGYFGLVVGVNRFNNREALMESGADICIDDFSKFSLDDPELLEEYFSRQGNPIFPANNELFERLEKKKPVIFLDYDGTLSPIVAQPEDAVLSESMKNTLKQLADLLTVAIVTGRDKQDVEQRVGLDELIYAGSHGYIITGPNGLQMEHPDSRKLIPRLDEMEKQVKILLEERTRGTKLDRKRYAIGIHYRNARPEDEKIVYEIVDELLEKHQGFKKGEGKKILEIKPDLDWHKGKAVDWIMDALGLSRDDDLIPMYIGDDITDEDAFETLRHKGIGIMVGGHGKKTAAGYWLKNVFQVQEFFNKLIEMYSK